MIRLDPISGAQILLASGGPANPSSPLNLPQRIARGAGGHLVVLDSDPIPVPPAPALIEVNVDTGAQTLRPLPSDLGMPLDLAVEPSGDAIVLATPPAGGSPAVLRIDQSTGLATTVTSGGFLTLAPAMASLALDGTGSLYIFLGGAVGGSLIRVDLATGEQAVVSKGGFLALSGDLEVGASGDIFVTNDSLSTRVARVDPVLGTQTPISTGGFLSSPSSLATVGGSIFVGLATPFPGMPAVVEVVVATGGQRAVVDPAMTFPSDIAAQPLGDVYVAGMGGILEVDPGTGAVRLVTSGGFLGSVNDLTLDPLTGDLFTLGFDGVGGALTRVDPVLGSQLPVAVGGLLQMPAMNGLEMNSSGEVFALSFVGATPSVIRVDITTGLQTLLPDGGLLRSPVDLAIGAKGDLFILDAMANLGSPGIIRKDPATGAETLVPSGPFTDFPQRITGNQQQLFVTTGAPDPANRLLRVDPVTGTQTALSASNLLMFGFDLAVPVPEPDARAMQLACVAVVWLLAHRRRRRGPIQ